MRRQPHQLRPASQGNVSRLMGWKSLNPSSVRSEQRVIQFALKPTIITSAASRRRAKSRADVALKIYGHRPGHASCMNGGAACNNSTPRPHLGHFPSAVWQGTTTERTAVLRCGGISGSCAVDISPPLPRSPPSPPPPLPRHFSSSSSSLSLSLSHPLIFLIDYTII